MSGVGAVGADDVRVVVVDDDADAAESLKQLLELDGYNVRTASDAPQALRVVAEHEALCVLLDINLPGMDGNGLARALRAVHGPGMVLVAVTGHATEGDRVACERAGIDFVLPKPVDVKVLRTLLPPIA